VNFPFTMQAISNLLLGSDDTPATAGKTSKKGKGPKGPPAAGEYRADPPPAPHAIDAEVAAMRETRDAFTLRKAAAAATLEADDADEGEVGGDTSGVFKPPGPEAGTTSTPSVFVGPRPLVGPQLPVFGPAPSGTSSDAVEGVLSRAYMWACTFVGVPDGVGTTACRAYTKLKERASSAKTELATATVMSVGLDLLKWAIATLLDFLQTPAALSAWCFIGAMAALYRWATGSVSAHSAGNVAAFVTGMIPTSTSSDMVVVAKSVTMALTMFGVGKWVTDNTVSWAGHVMGSMGYPPTAAQIADVQTPGSSWLARGAPFDTEFALAVGVAASRVFALWSMWSAVGTAIAPAAKILGRTAAGFLAWAKTQKHSYVPKGALVSAPLSAFDHVSVLYSGALPVGLGVLIIAAGRVCLATAGHLLDAHPDLRAAKSVGAGPFSRDAKYDLAYADTSLSRGVVPTTPDALASGSVAVGWNGRELCASTSPNGIALSPAVFSSQGLTTPGYSGGPVWDGEMHFVGIDVKGEGETGYGVPGALIVEQYVLSHHEYYPDEVFGRRRKGGDAASVADHALWFDEHLEWVQRAAGVARAAALLHERDRKMDVLVSHSFSIAKAVAEVVHPQAHSATAESVAQHAGGQPGAGKKQKKPFYRSRGPKQTTHSSESAAPGSQAGAPGAALAASSLTHASQSAFTPPAATPQQRPHSQQRSPALPSTPGPTHPHAPGGHADA